MTVLRKKIPRTIKSHNTKIAAIERVAILYFPAGEG
jgi:hypothetical protein